MAKLSNSEKKEFLEVSCSSQFRHDMRMLKKMNQEKLIQNNENTLDLYIEFLNETNELIKHRPKKFKAIKGEFFIL